MIRNKNSEKGVSSSIGVVLTVVLIFLLASLAAINIYNIYQEKGNEPVADLEAKQSGTIRTGYDVTITLTSIEQADHVTIKKPDGTVAANLSNPGEKTTVSDLQPGDKIQMIGNYKGKKRLLRVYTVEKTQ